MIINKEHKKQCLKCTLVISSSQFISLLLTQASGLGTKQKVVGGGGWGEYYALNCQNLKAEKCLQYQNSEVSNTVLSIILMKNF